jgi:NAD-dependent SIR2 family protein deacetylase
MPKCTRCGEVKPLNEFHRRGSDDHASQCKVCRRELYQLRKADYQEQARIRGRLRTYRDSRRTKLIIVLGGRCVCCGETELPFLVIDHVHGQGVALRKRHDAYTETRRIWKLVEAGTAALEVQVLCANCNMAKERKGGCPHQLVPAGMGCDR